ncbi:MAG: hypothetical protein IPI46_13170 [Bacteroidetes bacterium]|nr:hypothetical protein [Bacteroidota bacterium]
MNTKAIDQINNKLKVIPDSLVNDVLQYLEFLYFKNRANEFVLTDEQINLLDKRSETPIGNCVPADKLMANLKNKYSV